VKAILVPRPGGPESLVYGDAPDPIAGPGEELVLVHAAGVNRADLLQAAGKYPPPPGASPILGMEVAGELAATGERVFALLAGGGYAEKVAVPSGLLMPIPHGLSFVDAAAIPEVFFTAYLNLFREGALARGERLLVHAAASGVGTAAVQLAKRAGAEVIGTTRSPAKCDAVRLLGADLALYAGNGQFAERIEAHHGQQAIDLILDPVGGANLEQNIRLLRLGGRLVLIATMGGREASLDLGAVLSRRLRIIGSTLRSRPLSEKMELTHAFRTEVLPGFLDGALRPVIDSVFALSEAEAAHRRMAANENIGKIVLRVA